MPSPASSVGLGLSVLQLSWPWTLATCCEK
jgi:hypothetical protein